MSERNGYLPKDFTPIGDDDLIRTMGIYPRLLGVASPPLMVDNEKLFTSWKELMHGLPSLDGGTYLMYSKRYLEQHRWYVTLVVKSKGITYLTPVPVRRTVRHKDPHLFGGYGIATIYLGGQIETPPAR